MKKSDPIEFTRGEIFSYKEYPSAAARRWADPKQLDTERAQFDAKERVARLRRNVAWNQGLCLARQHGQLLDGLGVQLSYLETSVMKGTQRPVKFVFGYQAWAPRWAVAACEWGLRRRMNFVEFFDRLTADTEAQRRIDLYTMEENVPREVIDREMEALAQS